MTDSKHSHPHCAVQNCKMSVFNKIPGTSFHPFPTTNEMRNKWLNILKSRCSSIDWARSRICSRHFENRYFDIVDSRRKLRDNALPSLFPASASSTQRVVRSLKPVESTPPRTKIDRLLNRMTQTQLLDDVKSTMRLIKVPDNFSDYVNDDLHCNPDTPVEAQLWLLIKKQDHLITRLMQLVLQNKKHVEVLQKNMEESRNEKKEMEQSLENYKYIAKCLQEKHATLEEQIEILTAVESR
ncbi:THAP domain-containing protein 1-like [Pectinophora gossypiella]|uniref:THAP-type domain-containing protein n=1 Tax=Pectinophora gossypiella TaxID=13191 RepID=A0A1E1WGY3_PECGO|nr:THAP domain-containing protein 1-like [Pectinophora gossypiella]